jgi:hypothetical protein
VKAGSFLMFSPLTVVVVCPGGFGSAPGPPCASAVNAAAPGDDAGNGVLAGGTAVGSGARGAATARGPGAAAARLGRAALTTTSGTRTEPGAGCAGGLDVVGAGPGAGCSGSDFGASVGAGDGADESCVRPGAGISTLAESAMTKGHFGRDALNQR